MDWFSWILLSLFAEGRRNGEHSRKGATLAPEVFRSHQQDCGSGISTFTGEGVGEVTRIRRMLKRKLRPFRSGWFEVISSLSHSSP
jgi:hypothetical protein